MNNKVLLEIERERERGRVGRLEDWKMNEFTEFVGFSIVGCETQCKALF